jgi:hypothetical protein
MPRSVFFSTQTMATLFQNGLYLRRLAAAG